MDKGNLNASRFERLSASWIERYIEYVKYEKRLANRTVELYKLDLEKLTGFSCDSGISLIEVRSSHVRRWVSQMNSAGRSGRGIALILSGWRGFYSWLGRQGQISSNPIQDVRAPKSAKPLPKALSVDEAMQLTDFRSDKNIPWLQARDVAMLELFYSSGLRVSELTSLDVVASEKALGWIDLKEAEAHVLGKGSKARIVPVGSKAVQSLKNWLNFRSGVQSANRQTALFIGRTGTRLTSQSVWQRLRQRGAQAGVRVPLHPHMLRHSFASHILQSSSDLRAVQELLGHANITTTQVYTRLDFQHLSKAYDEAHPRAKIKKLV